MIVFPNFAANLAQTEDVVTKYADIVQSEAEQGLPLSGKQTSTNVYYRCD